MRHLIHLVDNTKFEFVPDLDEIGHYEMINLNGRSTHHKPDKELSPSSGSIVIGPSRYAGTVRGPLRSRGSGFFMRKGDKIDE